MSSFFGLNIAKSGLFAAQKSLNTVSHNIANANTRGYSRQRIELSASNPLSSPGGSGMIGTGVDSKHVNQIRDEFLDVKFRSENTVYGQWDFRNKSLEEIEAIMNEPGDSGIRKVMDDFFSSFEELSKDASSVTTRTVVRERAIAFTNSMNQMQSQFEKMIKDTDSSIESTVNQINGYANDIARLNEQIYQAEMGGSNANDLRDQRNVLLDDLSKIVDVEINEVSQGSDNLSKKMIVAINGQPLVSHNKVDRIVMQKQPHKYKDELGIEFDVREIGFESGSPINTDNIKGALKAQIDMRDNINDIDGAKGIPYYMKKLDEFVNRLAAELDVQHFAGYGLDSAGTGNLFFKDRDISKDTSDSSLFTVNEKLGLNQIHDPRKIGSEYSQINISNIDNLINLNDSSASVKITVGSNEYDIDSTKLKAAFNGSTDIDGIVTVLDDNLPAGVTVSKNADGNGIEITGPSGENIKFDITGSVNEIKEIENIFGIKNGTEVTADTPTSSAKLASSEVDPSINLNANDADIEINVNGTTYTIANADIKALDMTKSKADILADIQTLISSAKDSGANPLSSVGDVTLNGGVLSITPKDNSVPTSIQININTSNASNKSEIENLLGISDGIKTEGTGDLSVNSIKEYIAYQKSQGKTESEAIKEWEDTYEGYTLAADDEGNWYEVENVSAKDIKISSKIEKDVDYIAVAKKHNDDGQGIAGDNSNIKAIGDLRHDDSMFTWGSPDDFVKSLVSNLGVEAQEAQRMVNNQGVLVTQIENTRQSISGVSMDEEMSNMIKFQQSYNACARMITAVDEMIDVIVNRMGKVGL